MSRVKIVEIKSSTDPETKEEGKQVVFAEVHDRPRVEILEGGPEARLVDGLVQQLRRMGFHMPLMAERRVPKIILFLTERESDEIGIPLEVNRVYELSFREGRIELKDI